MSEWEEGKEEEREGKRREEEGGGGVCVRVRTHACVRTCMSACVDATGRGSRRKGSPLSHLQEGNVVRHDERRALERIHARSERVERLGVEVVGWLVQ